MNICKKSKIKFFFVYKKQFADKKISKLNCVLDAFFIYTCVFYIYIYINAAPQTKRKGALYQSRPPRNKNELFILHSTQFLQGGPRLASEVSQKYTGPDYNSAHGVDVAVKTLVGKG